MKQFIYLFIGLNCLGGPYATAQSTIADVLKSIEKNNVTLQALRADAETQKLNNRTDLTLPDPEVEIGYLWGDPVHTGPRKNYAVKQALDLSVIGGSRQRLARERNSMVDARYAGNRLEVLARAEQACIDLIYYNRKTSILRKRTEAAERIDALYRKNFEAGGTTKLEQNKAALNLVRYKGELERAQIEQNTLRSGLAGLNGGTPITLNDERYADKNVPENFETWFATAAEQLPEMVTARGQTSVEKRNISLTRNEALPVFTIGYAQEDVPDQSFKGITVGMNIPLWSKRNKVKSAKSAYVTAQMNEQDVRINLHAQLSGLYRKALSLKRTVNEYRQALARLNNAELLLKALNAGEISVVDYLIGMEIYYETEDLVEDSEYELAKTVSELLAVEL